MLQCTNSIVKISSRVSLQIVVAYGPSARECAIWLLFELRLCHTWSSLRKTGYVEIALFNARVWRRMGKVLCFSAQPWSSWPVRCSAAPAAWHCLRAKRGQIMTFNQERHIVKLNCDLHCLNILHSLYIDYVWVNGEPRAMLRESATTHARRTSVRPLPHMAQSSRPQGGSVCRCANAVLFNKPCMSKLQLSKLELQKL